MATTSRSRPCVELDIHDDHSHQVSTSSKPEPETALGELSLNNIHNIKRKSSLESLARQLDNFHIHGNDKENKSRVAAEVGSPSTAPSTNGVACGSAIASVSDEFKRSHPLALASQHIPSTQEQLSKHQEGRFDWLLSIPVKPAKGRRPRSDSHGDAELRHGEKTLYFGCNLVHRRSQSGGELEHGKSTDVYTLLATRLESEQSFSSDVDAEMEELLQHATPNASHLNDGMMAERRGQTLAVPKSPRLVVDVKDVNDDGASDLMVSEPSRPVSRIEDSVEALDKLEEEIEALAQVTRLERVLSPDASTQNHTKTTPLKRATSVRVGTTPARSKTLERSASVRKPTPARDDEKTASGSTTSSARKVPRPTSLLPPKPPAKSTKAPTVATFELPGEAVARRLKEQREQRRSQQISAEQAAALAAAYSPSKPHFKSSKPPTRPTFELPGEAISRKKREEREAKLRAQEEEERKRREFKARPIRSSLVPGSVPRETLTSLARQKSRQTTEGSSDSASTTITSAQHSSISNSNSKRLSTAAPSSTSRTTATPPAASTLRGRPPPTRSAHHHPAARGQVFARENGYTAEREREKRERENAARVAREKAAERSREMSRLWAERQRVKREKEREKVKGEEEGQGQGKRVVV
ncbi:hypothetical protein NEMBOFW57_009913 [Staphylotrichum longicolle]|uniref:Carboxylesterase family protein n=1 Tax=Staphylotrichum longicolle TaxID=669026 RepID=A0AAD4EQ61_9PEZI|nr:hypothetical protein NEMBOFW57_009913 [Staphylotrichum longicolle]